MTDVTEVGRPKAEEDGHRAAVSALVLQEVGPVFRAHLNKNMCVVTTTHTQGS